MTTKEIQAKIKELEALVDAPKVEVKTAEGTKEEEEEEVKKNLRDLVKTVSKEVVAEIKTDLKAWAESQKESQTKKAGLYNTDVQKKRTFLNDKFRATVKAIRDGNVESLKELGGFASRKELTTDGDNSPYGGYAVDSELSAEIRHLVTQYGVARQEMNTQTLSKNSYKANDLATDVSVFWTDEASQINSTQIVLGQGTLELKKLASIVAVTSELLSDEEIDLFSFIGGRIAEAFAEAEDEAFFNGDGTSTYGSFTGLLEAGDVNSVTLASGDTGFSSVSAEKLLDMQDSTPQGAQKNAKYFMHRSVFNLIRKLRSDSVSAGDSAGLFLYQAPGAGEPIMLWNKPVVLVEVMPTTSDTASDTAFVIYGDLRRGCILGTKPTISGKRFDAGIVRNVADNADINLITTDREALRWTERVGYIRIIPTAITTLSTSAS